MNPNSSYRKAHVPKNQAGEAVPMRAVNFADTRAKLNAYLDDKGEPGYWLRRKRKD